MKNTGISNDTFRQELLKTLIKNNGIQLGSFDQISKQIEDITVYLGARAYPTVKETRLAVERFLLYLPVAYSNYLYKKLHSNPRIEHLELSFAGQQQRTPHSNKALESIAAATLLLFLGSNVWYDINEATLKDKEYESEISAHFSINSHKFRRSIQELYIDVEHFLEKTSSLSFAS